jgi:hypothetical protein
VLNVINVWSIAESGLAEPVLDNTEQLPQRLDDVYKDLWARGRVRRCCRDSSLWKSLHHHATKTAILHLFPFGSTASRLVALIFAECLRDEGRNVMIHPSVITDESEAEVNWLIRMCARQTWQWLSTAKSKGAIDLTLRPAEFKRGYIWVAALARLLFREMDLSLFHWDDDTERSQPITVPKIESYCSSPVFLDYYLNGIVPEEEQDKQFIDDYDIYKSRLDELMDTPGNEKFRLVLETWDEWRWPEQDKDEQGSQKERPSQWQMPPGLAEA